MTHPNTYTIKQLALILGALKNKRCNPSSRQEALKAIERAATQLDLTADDIFAAAGGLLDGRFTDEEFREELIDTTASSESPVDRDTVLAMIPGGVPTDGEALSQQSDGDETDESVDQPATEPAAAAKPTRTNTKQARLIEMLRRDEGATIDQIAGTMAWEKHTMRGVISGALKKKLGLTITSEKIEGRGTIYHLED